MIFRPNRDFLAELKAQRSYVEGMAVVGRRVVHEAQRVAPVGETHDYVDSFAVVIVGSQVFVTNFDFAAHLVEWGSVNNPAYAPIRRGVRNAGLKLHGM